jgi:hypothetical protein
MVRREGMMPEWLVYTTLALALLAGIGSLIGHLA